MKSTLVVLCVAGLAACDSSMTQTKLPDLPTAAAAPAPQAKAPDADPDKALAARVKQALEAEAKLLADGIDITASDGAITLWGTTATAAERTRAAGVAAKIDGVKSVDNKLAVVKGS